MKAEGRSGERQFEGVGVAPGIAIGLAHRIESGELPVPEYTIEPDQVGAEKERFADAVARAQKQLRKLKTKCAGIPGAAGEELGYLLDAHLQMLTGSRLVRGVVERIEGDRQNAEAAVRAVIADIAKGFARMSDAYLTARIEDIREAGNRLIRQLTKTPYKALHGLPPGAVILAEELTPADTALLDPSSVAGFATVLGGAESHTAIMARSLGLPAVLGSADLLTSVRGGETVVVDGNAGRVVVDPAPKTLAQYRRLRAAWLREQATLAGFADLPAVTRDGHVVVLQANLELPREVKGVIASGAGGIGLLRTEFLYMNRDDLPGEDEQYAILRGIVEAMGERPVTIRTLDVGGEKLAYSLGPHIGQSTNPALGLRAIRLSLIEPKLLEAQLGAILRAGAHGKVRVLLPMISTVSEVRRVREIMEQVIRRLKRRAVRIADPLPPLGVMIEVPGAALSADALALAADFFAIGTNDLTMYTLAIDRADDQVAHLYNPLHPAVLRLVQFAVEAALRAHIPVSVCGEVAGDPRYTALLLGLGVRELSMAPTSLSRVKRRVRHLELVAATQRARAIMEQWDEARISELLDEFNTGEH
ncbi:MAG: phosphoenolpyruvate--protein phosphotransferase [Proteobacteria bacterium]|nr:phosphoenolpyruvate--protein phosphotransferase [Pseudomonadota bacterium]MBI3498461.1 phosphoenolpyruvate--protein phosphotransferase [Pseudomonadota bacterium]